MSGSALLGLYGGQAYLFLLDFLVFEEGLARGQTEHPILQMGEPRL